jgi:type IX secretion system PorP/SprF family membrane protein
MRGIQYILGNIFKYSLLVCLSISALAQQSPGLSLYHLNNLYFNPAAAGAGRDAYLQNHYRNQWTSYETSQDGSGNLGTNVVGLSIPLNFQNLGMGLILMNDKTPSGVGQQVMRLQLAYHLPLASGAQLSMGVGFGMQSKSFDGRVFRVRDANDPLAIELSGKQVSQALPDFNAGILYTTDALELGLGIAHLNRSAYDFNTSNVHLVNELALNLHASGTLGLTDRFDVSPFTQLNYYQGTLLPQAGAKIIYQQQFWVGAGYRWDDATSFMTGVSLFNNRFDVAYALDLSVINTGAKANLSHEIMLRYVLPVFHSATRFVPIKTPRFN